MILLLQLLPPLQDDWVRDMRPKIHLTIKLAPRKVGKVEFNDRNVEDVKDGYVSCEPFRDTTRWGEVRMIMMIMFTMIFMMAL